MGLTFIFSFVIFISLCISAWTLYQTHKLNKLEREKDKKK